MFSIRPPEHGALERHKLRGPSIADFRDNFGKTRVWHPAYQWLGTATRTGGYGVPGPHHDQSRTGFSNRG